MLLVTLIKKEEGFKIMDITQLYLAIIIGTVLSLLIEEFFGISAGGIIVPGYLALVCDDLPTIILIFAISLITYYLVNFQISKVMILFGKRKFTITILIALILKLVIELAFPALSFVPFSSIAFRGFGAITPALLASSYSKQGIRYTIPACLVVTAVTFGLVQLINLI